ncbi:MAG: murein L,D-transpeptidase, partial [Actinomadura sp.]
MVAVAAATTAMLAAGCGGKSEAESGGGQQSQNQAATKLPQATTYTTLRGLPLDPNAFAKQDGTVVHP